MSQLNIICNPSALIIKLIPADILYYIFTYAIHTPQHRLVTKTALAISHVCQHWRKFALGWPVLWRFLDLNYSHEIVELFLERSKNTPLELSYVEHSVPTASRQNLILESYANQILPRLRYLTLQLPLSKFPLVQHVFQNSDFQPFQLRGLKIVLESVSRRYISTPVLTDIVRLDISCLQSLNLTRLDLPWLELPRNNILTQFIFHPRNPPILSQLLVFLSSCSLLHDLELSIPFHSSRLEPPTIPFNLAKLDFPKLERLVLTFICSLYSGITDFDYARELSVHIGNMGLLSYFSLYYEDFKQWPDSTTILAPSNFFGLVPRDTFCHFSNQVYLSIDLCTNISTTQSFQILSSFECPPSQAGLAPSPSLCLEGSWKPDQPLDRSVLELIYALPKIAYLKLINEAFKFLVSWDLDFHNAFPRLNTLELVFSYPEEEVPNALPVNFPKIQRIILSVDDMSPERLHVISGAGVEVLELKDWTTEKSAELEDVVSTLRQRGVEVLTTSI